jgi:regulator of RNase E activity RraA
MNTLRLYPAAPTPDAALIARYRSLSVPAISDSLERSPGIVGIHPVGACLDGIEGAIVGPALTVRTRPGDNLVVHKALDLARPGDMLVIDARGEVVNAILGELMVQYAAVRGLCGIVVDGAVRDYRAMSNGDFPVFARAISHLGPYKSGPGEIHGTISVGGVGVHDGDLVVGD